MSKGLYPRKPFSATHRENLSKASKGNKANLGRKHSEAENEKMSEAKKGKHTGWHHSLETRNKLSQSNSGEKSVNWKGGISLINRRIRNGLEIRLWRTAVFERDDFTCQKYGTRGGKLVAHHINNFSERKDLRFAIDNGITLSEEAHIKFHKNYGFRNNTKEQLQDYLKH